MNLSHGGVSIGMLDILLSGDLASKTLWHIFMEVLRLLLEPKSVET